MADPSARSDAVVDAPDGAPDAPGSGATVEPGASADAPAASEAPHAEADRTDARSTDGATNGRAPSVHVRDVRLTGDRLVVRPPGAGERTTNSGLLIPATAAPAPKRLTWADVALVGPDVRVAKVGDRVLFLPQSGLEVELDGEELVLLRERDVQAVSAPTANAERVPGQYL